MPANEQTKPEKIQATKIHQKFPILVQGHILTNEGPSKKRFTFRVFIVTTSPFVSVTVAAATAAAAAAAAMY